ncbi:MAG: Type 4 fimbrial assembly protein pilC [Candidatus Jorgensenbacteria bacterium GW2011_GWB1_50_10]|uniref:Type 4 fimbrial assembly protein pilC n=1 Tax=Candidatus Jorgensenbacteria bacterium GW2011_GWB1_50_10 TaxID=1618665 RepID=A0A0G1YHL6_9BACT|nr:MAG: Type 4 fimbrial assembly protein pilC [Candidatus Jorgensenbacteria bacterium GW2011_GWB1_50_10]
MRYIFEASSKKGEIIKGEFDADTRAGVVEYLGKRKLIPVVIEPKVSPQVFSLSKVAFFETVTTLDQIILVRNLGAAVKVGINIKEALEIIVEDAQKPVLKSILQQIKLGIENGQPLWKGFAVFPEHFPPFFIGMIKAAEASGELDKKLDELAQYLTREHSLAKKVQGAFVYPLVLLGASFGVIVFLLNFVIPKIETTFRRSQVELPVFTRIILQLSHAIRYSFVLDVFVLLILIAVFLWSRRTETGKRVGALILFRLPIAKDVVKKVALVRFTRALGSLLDSGISFAESLRLSAESIGNEYYKIAINKTAVEINKGIPFSKGLSAYPELFPKFLVSFVTVGEKTGNLSPILKNFADFYDEEVDYALKNLTTILEPVLLLIMGLVIAFIVLSILMPIYQFVGKFI